MNATLLTNVLQISSIQIFAYTFSETHELGVLRQVVGKNVLRGPMSSRTFHRSYEPGSCLPTYIKAFSDVFIQAFSNVYLYYHCHLWLHLYEGIYIFDQN